MFDGMSSCLDKLFPYIGSVSSWTSAGRPGVKERYRGRPGVATQDVLGAGVGSRQCHGVSTGGTGVSHFASEPHGAGLSDTAYGTAAVRQQHHRHCCVAGKTVRRQCDVMHLRSGGCGQECRQRDR